MKKKSIVLIVTIILSVSIIFGISYVKADSGWDYDYDSGGWDSDYDSDWGGGWDSDWDSDWDSSYHGSSYTSVNDDLVMTIIIITIFALVFFASLSSYNQKNSINTNNIPKKRWSSYLNTTKYPKTTNMYNKSINYNDLNDEEILSKLGISSSDFKQKAFDIYKNIQNAWTEFDYNKLHKYTTDEIYNSYIMQLDTLKLKNQKNIMSDIECIDIKIHSIKEENGILNIDVYMNIKMFDYVVNNNGHVIRGTSKRKANIEYELTFVKSNKKTSKKSTICPNCGAKISATTGGKCEYCGTVVVIDAKEFVMSRKTCINQRMD